MTDTVLFITLACLAILICVSCVVWSKAKRNEEASGRNLATDARREFLKGGVGIAAGTIMLSAGAIDKVFSFFFGPRLTPEEESDIMATRLKRLESTAEQRKLELERESSNVILVAALSDLSTTEGKYLIDYQMCPAMAFLGDDGLPIVISAKCTHLGCTVGNEVDKDGKILCPCHVSFFDIKTGKPNADAPAKAPLPMLSWALLNKQGKLVASRSSKGLLNGDTKADAVKDCNLYISKNDEVKV